MTEKSKKNKEATRPPIVVVMGHIDHGKTKILDWYRKTKVVEEESGGITQHIGAYEVEHGGKKIIFIDTPGHEAFSKLRSRGAKVADIAILVVAADEGVKPQTQEAIQIIKENRLPLVVAINKIDKPGANSEKVKQQLAEAEVLLESYGGKVPAAEISAKEGKNMDELLEVLILVAELEDLKAHSEKPAEGVVIEAHRDPRRGNTATLLILDGTINKELTLVIGRSTENIKILEDFRGRSIDTAGPSSPILIAGIGELPMAGLPFRAFKNKKEAEDYKTGLPEEVVPVAETPITEEGKPVFNIILKSDVSGSKEAMEGLFEKIKSDAIDVRIIRSEVGDVNESDVKMAQATNRVTVVGFKVKADPAVLKLAEEANIRIITGEVVYELLDGVKKAVEERMPAVVKRNGLGVLKVLKTFKKEGHKQIIGGRVEEGLVRQGALVEIKRGKDLMGKGVVAELQRNRAPVKEVAKGSECGVMADAKETIQEGDLLEVFEEEMVNKTL